MTSLARPAVSQIRFVGHSTPAVPPLRLQRWLVALGLIVALTSLFGAWASVRSLPVIAAVTLGLGWLMAQWISGYRRGSLPAWGVLAEVLVLYFVCVVGRDYRFA